MNYDCPLLSAESKRDALLTKSLQFYTRHITNHISLFYRKSLHDHDIDIYYKSTGGTAGPKRPTASECQRMVLRLAVKKNLFDFQRLKATRRGDAQRKGRGTGGGGTADGRG